MIDTPIKTRDEAIKYLRLDLVSNNPSRTLDYYRRVGRLRAMKLGRHIVFHVDELNRFIEVQQEAVQR